MTYKLILYKLVGSYFYETITANRKDGNILFLFQNYALIRDSIQDEFEDHMEMLDEMFAPFMQNL